MILVIYNEIYDITSLLAPTVREKPRISYVDHSIWYNLNAKYPAPNYHTPATTESHVSIPYSKEYEDRKTNSVRYACVPEEDGLPGTLLSVIRKWEG